jgi:3-methyladenine DNA glycosylase AlkC
MDKDFTAVPFNHLGVDARTASLFFAVFSRFEYALKQAKLFQRNGRANRTEDAKADWNKFSEQIADAFDKAAKEDRAKVRQAVEYMIEKPPKKHIRVGDE